MEFQTTSLLYSLFDVKFEIKKGAIPVFVRDPLFSFALREKDDA